MFCPSCGASLPDDAKFCGNCGASITPQTQTPPPTAPSGTMPGGGYPQTPGTTPYQPTPSFSRTSTMKSASNPAALVAVIALAVALVFSLFPWFSVKSNVAGASQALASSASAVNSISSALTGKSLTGDIPVLATSYSVFSFPILSSQIGFYDDLLAQGSSLADKVGSNARSILKAFGVDTSSSTVKLASPEYSPFPTGALLIFVFILWLVALVVGIYGAFLALKKNNLSFVKIGAILFGVCALIFMIAYGMFSTYATGFPIFALLCLIAAIASFVCALVMAPSRKTAAKR